MRNRVGGLRPRPLLFSSLPLALSISLSLFLSLTLSPSLSLSLSRSRAPFVPLFWSFCVDPFALSAQVDREETAPFFFPELRHRQGRGGREGDGDGDDDDDDDGDDDNVGISNGEQRTSDGPRHRGKAMRERTRGAV